MSHTLEGKGGDGRGEEGEGREEGKEKCSDNLGTHIHYLMTSSESGAWWTVGMREQNAENS